MGDRRAADRRPRPARAHVDIAARQSLREPAARGRRRRSSVGRSRRSWRRCDPRRRRRDRCRSCASLAIKWPNDLLLDGAKFAGILIEGQGGGDAGNAVVVGIGVNCAAHPMEADYPATDLAEASPHPKRCSARCRRRCSLASRNGTQGGLFTIRAEWPRARPVSAEYARASSGPRYYRPVRGADEAGGLRLRLPDGAVATVAAGDVFLRSAAPAEMTC